MKFIKNILALVLGLYTKEDMEQSWNEGARNGRMYYGGSIGFDEWIKTL